MPVARRIGNYRRKGRFPHLRRRSGHLHVIAGGIDCPAVTHPLLARLRDAARQNAIPAVLLQALTLALLVAWWRWPAAHELLERLLRLKLAWGVAYSFLAGALFAGLLPRLVLRGMGRDTGRFPVELAFALAFWGWRSVEVDLMYRAQAWCFAKTQTSRISSCCIFFASRS